MEFDIWTDFLNTPLFAIACTIVGAFFYIRRIRYNAWAERHNREIDDIVRSIPGDLAKAGSYGSKGSKRKRDR